jgi:hypothetical protein
MLIAPRAYGVGRLEAGRKQYCKRVLVVSAFKSQKALLKIYILITGLWKCNYAPLCIDSVGRVADSISCYAVGLTGNGGAEGGWSGGGVRVSVSVFICHRSVLLSVLSN